LLECIATTAFGEPGGIGEEPGKYFHDDQSVPPRCQQRDPAHGWTRRGRKRYLDDGRRVEGTMRRRRQPLAGRGRI